MMGAYACSVLIPQSLLHLVFRGAVRRWEARGAYTGRFLGEATWEEKGTAGDHKGPPSRSPPPSPLRTDEHVSKKTTGVSVPTLPLSHETSPTLQLRFRDF